MTPDRFASPSAARPTDLPSPTSSPAPPAADPPSTPTSGAYSRVTALGRTHVTVCHTPGKRVWAKDLDGDGLNEVHNNTIEGFWTGLRNFLRPFRGVNKIHLRTYAAMHAWAHNLKTVSNQYLRILLLRPQNMVKRI